MISMLIFDCSRLVGYILVDIENIIQFCSFIYSNEPLFYTI